MLRIISILVFLIILVIGVEFAAVNSGPVTVNYFLGTASWPLSFVVVCAFSIGVLVAALIAFSVALPLRVRVGRLKRAVADQEQELGSLRKRVNRGAS